jgi:hypothetical protein
VPGGGLHRRLIPSARHIGAQDGRRLALLDAQVAAAQNAQREAETLLRLYRKRGRIEGDDED